MRHPGVAAVVAYEPGGDERLVSRDRRSTYLLATYKRDERGATDAIEARMRALPYVTLGGGAIAAPQVGDQVSADILRAEIIAFPLLFLLSLLVFRSARCPRCCRWPWAATTILLSFLAIRVVNAHVNPMSIYALNLINGLGLGLAIDYSLFMVSRFREELAAGRSREEALAVTMRTAGHVVFFSAITVACALAALIVFRQRFLYSMGVGGALCALIAAGVSLTLLPALLGALGERVNAGGPRRWKDAIAREAAGERSGFWYRHSQRVMRRPVPYVVVAGALLIAMGLPFLRIEFTGVDASVLPSAAERAGGRRRDQGRVPAERDVAGVRGDRAGDAGGAGARVRGAAACSGRAAGGRRGADRPDRAGRAARRGREGPRRRRAGGGRAVRLLGRRADGAVRRPAGVAAPTICRSRWRSCARRRC